MVLIVVGFFWFIGEWNGEDEIEGCVVDEDCVAASCCHADSCVASAEVPICVGNNL